ncbi:MAG TPA: DUF2149 domain-containing protein [Nitrosomonas europaea]|uniref:DUF2149 domain-containing protein n=1 Tax=Nitrosomonas europaea TaxID=915 RepID=UPI0024923534|nr:DUF2149 domain-containing protein [Nitrosomonas europaea]HRN82567.1 DUF2149 domain-containing protein [Nitrosomonas europaea]HRO55415.1 DUF2149 domain-containing protein [Nitrosomonas europaea]HUM73070.1 DUF2149 domain-containing protein [Nitrosomonas europaea]
MKDPGKLPIEITVKQSKELKHYKSTGQIGEGEGTKAGTAFHLKDGSMIYVPEQEQ